MHDEMSIREDLVYDKKNDKLVGFVHPQAWNFGEKVIINIRAWTNFFVI